jgi:hypothetical protein
MGKHRREVTTPEAPITSGRHRARKESSSATKNGLGIGVAAAVGMGAIAGAVWSTKPSESHSPVGASTPDVEPTAPETHTPTKKPMPSPTEAKPKDCPTVDPTLLARYNSHKVLPIPNIARFDTDLAESRVAQAQSPAEAMKAANAALDGKIVIRFATQHDSSVPTHNIDMTDRPTPVDSRTASLANTRQTLSGVLQAYDGLPEDFGTLRGDPLAVVVTNRIITNDHKESVNAGYVGENGKNSFLMTEMSDPAAKIRDTIRHESGHYTHEVGAGSMPEVDCYSDPSIQRPEHLTLYAEQTTNKRETAADTFGVGMGAHYSDEDLAAPYDAVNNNNFAVLMARLAEQGAQQQRVADALYDSSSFAPMTGVNQNS